MGVALTPSSRNHTNVTKKSFFAAVAAPLAMAAFGFMTAAHAEVYDFSYVDSATSGKNIVASGTITTGADAGSGFYDVTAITGFRNGSAITGLVPVNGYAGNDNLFSPTPSYFSFPGVSFSAADGNDYNIASDGGTGYIDQNSKTDPVGYPETAVNLTVSAVPEPASMALVGAGLLGLGVIRRKRV